MGSAKKHSAPPKTLLFLALLCTLALLPATAQASTDSIIQDCTDDGALNGHYSAGELKNALGNIPSDVNQYYSCDSLINEALLSLLNKKSHSGGGSDGKGGKGNEAFISKAQRKAIDKKVADATKVHPDATIPAAQGAAIKRAAGQTLASSATPSVPTALVVAVIGMFMLFAVELTARVKKRRGRTNS
ncbi:MAG: hypothetical protein ACRDKI_02195 [Solirubrobacterales bacterium]